MQLGRLRSIMLINMSEHHGPPSILSGISGYNQYFNAPLQADPCRHACPTHDIDGSVPPIRIVLDERSWRPCIRAVSVRDPRCRDCASVRRSRRRFGASSGCGTTAGAQGAPVSTGSAGSPSSTGSGARATGRGARWRLAHARDRARGSSDPKPAGRGVRRRPGASGAVAEPRRVPVSRPARRRGLSSCPLPCRVSPGCGSRAACVSWPRCGRRWRASARSPPSRCEWWHG